MLEGRNTTNTTAYILNGYRMICTRFIATPAPQNRTEAAAIGNNRQSDGIGEYMESESTN
jgi:hypothetical protein